MTKSSRREFLRLATLGMVSVALNRFLAACAPQPTPEALATLPHPTNTSAPAAAIPTGAAATSTPTATPTLNPPTPTASPTENPAKSRVLLAYFSRAGENYYYGERTHLDVGNTEVAAGMIRQLIGCDIHRIEPADAYPDDYEETVDRNHQEQEANARPAILNGLTSISSYDIVLLGSPIWGGRAPMIMTTFVEGLDFTGKTVYPFTTHAGSRLGTTVQDYTASCPGAIIGEGLAVRGEEVRDAGAVVEAWLRSINLLEA